jgi:hypothetical protein
MVAEKFVMGVIPSRVVVVRGVAFGLHFEMMEMVIIK